MATRLGASDGRDSFAFGEKLLNLLDEGAFTAKGIVMQICGWKTRSMFDRYDIKNEDDLREAAVQVATVRDKGAKARVKGISAPKSAP